MSTDTWEHIRFGEPEAWVADETYDASIAAKEGAHSTVLLWSRQVHAETGQTFHATSIRLETAVAVQNESQWKLGFNPRFQDVALHWLRVVRGGEKIDHRQKERMRLLQRETKLEHHVLDGNWTLVAVLDDVRPGDVIEAGYTYTHHHPITLGRCEAFFYVPSHLVVGCYRLQVLFSAAQRTPRFQASSDAPVREESAAGELTRWTWQGQQPAGAVRTPEAQAPGSFLDYTWIQVSDWSDWSQLAGRVAESWRQTLEDGGDALPSDFDPPAKVDAAAVTALVRRLQDNFRYLSVDLTAGGWIPSAPAITANRRYGDCKDLVWLAVAILRRWGVAARPILVGSRLRETVRTLLPMSLLFDHAVMEVEADGRARWFDLTLRSQGGAFDTQPIVRFEAGLPVVPGATLANQPGSLSPALHAIDESFYVDSRPGFPSQVEQVHHLEGWLAENTRRQRLALGPEGFSNQQSSLAQRRYGKAKRVGELLWRDDPAANVVEWVERFEVQDILLAAANKRVALNFPRSIVAETLAVPEDKPRRTPWALPWGAEYRHRIRAFNGMFGRRGVQRARWETAEITLTVDHAMENTVWSKTSRLIVKASQIPADRVLEYRRIALDFLRRASVQVTFRRSNKTLSTPAVAERLASAMSVAPVAATGDYPEATPGADWQRYLWRGGPVRRRVVIIAGTVVAILWLAIMILFVLFASGNH